MSDPANDTQFQSSIITSVERHTEGYSIGMDSGWHIYAPGGPITPEVGQEIRLYGKGPGYDVRGIVIDGHTFRYRTEEENRAHWEQERARELHDQRVRYEAGLARQQSEVAKLPAPFRRRMAEFMVNAPETAWRNQGYELATCQAALAILTACPTPEDVAAFVQLTWDEQVGRAPALDSLGLSGNQFGMACRLAHHALTVPENVWREHATICPIAGCREAGCHALTYA